MKSFFKVALLASTFAVFSAFAGSLKPIRQAHVTGTIYKYTLGQEISSETVCTIDTEVPVYDRRASGQSSWDEPVFASCPSTLNGADVNITVNGVVSLLSADQAEPASKVATIRMEVPSASKNVPDVLASASAGTEDLESTTIKLSTSSVRMTVSSTGAEEQFVIYLKFKD